MCYMSDENHENEGYGDPRRCPVHPWINISDPLGMFDAPCGRCEYEMEVGHDLDDTEGPDQAPDPNDPVVATRMGHPVRLSDLPDDDIPF